MMRMSIDLEMTMTRTDIHRPSAIIPTDYRFVAMRYVGPSPNEHISLGSAGRERITADMNRTGGKYSSHDHGGICHICGASCLYQAIFHHAASNTYIVTGETCADKMGLSDANYSLFKKQIGAERKNLAGKVKAQATLADMGLTALWDIYLSDSQQDRSEEGILREMVGKLVRYGSLSEKQVAFARTLLERIEGRAALAAQRAAENAASAFVGAVGDRLDLTLTCQWVRSFDTQFGTMTVHGFKDAAGNIVIYKGQSIADKGETLTLKATVKAHEEREGIKQTIINRPKAA
jgi:hypothetical protein